MTGSQMSKLDHFKDSKNRDNPTSLNGRIRDTHRVLINSGAAYSPAPEAAEIKYKEQQEFFVGHDGGYTSLIHIFRKC